MAGAALFAIRGVLDLGLEVWIASWQLGNAPVDAASQAAVKVRGVVAAALTLVGPLLLAGGLWTARSNGHASSSRLAAMGVLGALGLAATAGGFFAMAAANASVGFNASALNMLLVALTALQPVPLAILGVVALGIGRAKDRVRELSIAAGVAVLVAAGAWLQWRMAEWMSQGLSNGMPADWAATISLSNAVVLAGMLATIAGFALAGLRHRPLPGAAGETPAS